MCTGGTDGVWYRRWSHKRFTEFSDSPLLTILDEGFIHDIFGDPIFPLSQLVDKIEKSEKKKTVTKRDMVLRNWCLF